MKKTIIISLSVGILAFLAGYFISRDKIVGNQNFNAAGGEAQINANVISENKVAIQSLSGVIESINGESILLKIDQSSQRTVEVDAQTKIYFLLKKDPVEYQKEVEEYNKNAQAQMNSQLKPGEAAITPLSTSLSPEVFAKKIGLISDLKSGITITAVSDGRDIKDLKQFKAVEIYIPPAPNADDNAIVQPIK